MTLNLDRSTWTRVKFGDVVNNVNENVKDASAAGITRVVGLEHLDPRELKVQRWASTDDETTFSRRVRPGQTLFGKRRSYQRKTAYAEFDAICSGDILVFAAKDATVLLPELLPFIASTDEFYRMALETSAGSLSPRTRWSDIAKYEFDLPPLDEQKRIAELLWAVEHEIGAASAACVSAQGLLTVLIDQHFGVATGGTTLSDYCAPNGIRIGPFGAQLHAHDYVESGVPVVMPQDMVDNRISLASIQSVAETKAVELSAHRLMEGDVLLPRRGELDRRALVTEEESGWLCGTGSVRVRPRAEISSTALILALSAASTVAWLKANSTGTTMPNLNGSTVAKIPINLPTGADLADALREVDAVSAAKAEYELRRMRATALRSALLVSLLGGETR